MLKNILPLLLICSQVFAVGTPTAGTNPVKKIGTPLRTTDAGPPLMALRNDSASTVTGTNLTYGPLSMTSTGHLLAVATLAEQAVSSATGVASGSSLYKMMAGRTATSTIKPVLVDDFGQLQVVTALGAGLATSGNQVLEITELALLATRANQSTMLTSLATLATSAAQTTGNNSLAAIALSVIHSPINLNGSGTATGTSTVSTVVTLTAPANAVGFNLMNVATSSANIRWTIGRTATATLGQQLQPGRDTGFIPGGASLSVCAESGTQNIDVQWITP